LAEVVVVGASLGGLATAARLAKLGHSVTVLERGSAPSGLLAQVQHGGLSWDARPFSTTIPAVLRDLFRKSGRPLERYVDLELSTPARRHVFGDGTTLDLPTGSRGGQRDAVSAALGAAAGEAWTRFVDDQADLWTTLRAELLDVPDGVTRLTERKLIRALGAKHALASRVRQALADDRLRELAGYCAIRDASGESSLPGFGTVAPYVERTFGVWRAPGGAADLAQSLMQRMAERSVDVRFNREVARLLTGPAGVCGVALENGSEIPADVVVTAVSPGRVFGHLLEHDATRAAPPLFATGHASPVVTTYLALSPPAPDLPAEVVLHGEPLIAVHPSGAPSADAAPWTVVAYGPLRHDLLDTMAERGLDVRPGVIARHRAAPRDVTPTWSGPRDAAERARFAHPLPGLQCLGTGLVLGQTIPYVAWQAAHVADRIGKAS
jgi:UDP-galactopyranose mutase